MADDVFEEWRATKEKWRVIDDLLRRLPARSPLVETAPFIQQAGDVASDDPQLLRRVGYHARRLGHYDTARKLLGRIPAFVRCGSDDVQRAVDLVFMGRFGEARRELEAMNREELYPHEEAFLLMNWVPSCVLPCAPSTTVDEEALNDALARAEKLLRSADVKRKISPTVRKHYLAVVTEGRGLLALYCKQLDEALALLEKAHASHPSNPWITLALAEAFAAIGDHDAASDCWRRCADGAHPESFLANHALHRLRAPYR